MRYAERMAIEVQPLPLPLLVDLVNGWGTVPRAKADARDRPPLSAFSERYAGPKQGSPTPPSSGSPTRSTPSSPPAAPPSALVS